MSSRSKSIVSHPPAAPGPGRPGVLRGRKVTGHPVVHVVLRRSGAHVRERLDTLSAL